MNATCPACASRGSAAFGSKHGYAYYRCATCGTLFTPVSGESREIDALYDHYYDGASFEISEATSASLNRLIRECEPYRRTGNWLDVGFGEGGLLDLVGMQGWKCYGTEASEAALIHGAERGWTVTPSAANDERFAKGMFDVVSMIELLEHVPEPQVLLRDAVAMLRPGGVLYLTTPNASSINRRVLGLDWSVFSPPEHVTIWTEEGMRCALNSSGFEVLRVRTEGLNPSELISHFRSGKRQLENEPSRNEVAFALNDAMSKTVSRRVLKKCVNGVLTAMRSGDTLKVFAVKPEAHV